MLLRKLHRNMDPATAARALEQNGIQSPAPRPLRGRGPCKPVILPGFRQLTRGSAGKPPRPNRSSNEHLQAPRTRMQTPTVKRPRSSAKAQLMNTDKRITFEDAIFELLSCAPLEADFT